MAFTLEQLNLRVLDRAGAPPKESYTAKLIADGVERCAKKLGEESAEAIIAAVTRNKRGLQSEAADVLYHLLVLLRVSDVRLEDVMTELDRRTQQTGLEEKAARKGDPA